jgi:hypothetical protein
MAAYGVDSSIDAGALPYSVVKTTPVGATVGTAGASTSWPSRAQTCHQRRSPDVSTCLARPTTAHTTIKVDGEGAQQEGGDEHDHPNQHGWVEVLRGEEARRGPIRLVLLHRDGIHSHDGLLWPCFQLDWVNSR